MHRLANSMSQTRKNCCQLSQESALGQPANFLAIFPSWSLWLVRAADLPIHDESHATRLCRNCSKEGSRVAFGWEQNSCLALCNCCLSIPTGSLDKNMPSQRLSETRWYIPVYPAYQSISMEWRGMVYPGISSKSVNHRKIAKIRRMNKDKNRKNAKQNITKHQTH